MDAGGRATKGSVAEEKSMRPPAANSRVGSRSLVNRLLTLLLAGTVIMYVIGIIGLWLTSSRLIEDGLQKQALQWVTEIAEVGLPLPISKGKANLSIENRMRNFPEISFLRYYDASGKRVLRDYGWIPDKVVPRLNHRQLKKLGRIAASDQPHLFDSAFNGTYVRVISPIRIKSIRSDGLFDFDVNKDQAESVKVVGYIDLWIDMSAHKQELAKSIALGSLITAMVFLIFLAMGHRLIKKALSPLTDLQTPLARLAMGEIDVSVAAGGDKEIAAIGDALNVTISALKQRDERLRKLAEYDSLTGLFNRSYFSQLLEAEIRSVTSSGASSALLFIDLDRFKYVNDMLGHAAGDRLLIQVAALMAARLPENHVVCRFGGDEFTVIARRVSLRGAIEIAQSINEIMRDFHFIDQEQSVNVSCSIGIAAVTANCASAEEILSQADMACYDAKSRGRNRYHVYEPDQQEIRGMLTDIGWSELIKQALKEDGFRLVYQPIVSLAGEKKEYYEVLLRMLDKDGSIVSPAVFLPVADRFGLLADIDRWMITRAIKALAKFRSEGRDLTFSINLSGQAFEDPAIAQLIRDSLQLYRLPPSTVIFEITEQIAVRYIEKARHLIQGLIDLGCRFALDDFGVGFSSFNYLKRLPVSLIKIDGCFVENMATEPIDRAMVKSIAQIAHALGKQVVAEFVQNDVTLDLLKDYGVDYVQGCHIGMPSETLSRPVISPFIDHKSVKKGVVLRHITRS
jgi:diguanylate cyclase (GGDEF)-like protein